MAYIAFFDPYQDGMRSTCNNSLNPKKGPKGFSVYKPLDGEAKYLYLHTEKSMKIVSQLLLVIFAVATLAACGEMGKGPSKPEGSNSTQIAGK